MQIIPEMPDPEYFAVKAVSQSVLKQLAKPGGAARLRAEPREPTEPQRFGKLIHRAILQPERIGELYTMSSARRGSAQWISHERAGLGREVIKRQDVAVAGAIAGSVRHWSTTARLLLDTADGFEVAAFWPDHRTGLAMKMKADAVNRQYRALIDIKSTVDASPEAFPAACRKYGYDLQAAHYLRGWNTVADWQAENFVVIAVEKTPPYLVATYEFGLETLQAARVELDRLTDIYAGHVASDTWPGYPDYLQTINLNREAQ